MHLAPVSGGNGVGTQLEVMGLALNLAEKAPAMPREYWGTVAAQGLSEGTVNAGGLKDGGQGAGELCPGLSTSQLPQPGAWWSPSLTLSLPPPPHSPSYKALESVHLASSPHYQPCRGTPIPPSSPLSLFLSYACPLLKSTLSCMLFPNLQNRKGAPHPVILPCLRPSMGL